MIYAIVAITVAVAILTGYVIRGFARTWTNLDALNNYCIASFERLVRLEALIDDLYEFDDEEEVDADET